MLTITKETIMGLGERVEATAKDLEGKAQETFGKVTGREEDELAGKAKQTRASVQHAVEDMKDDAHATIN
ncbi:CsbD family protein [Synechococcus sp. CS-602]|nr:CsbD family protein [Synechococcus sp. CS-602]